MPLATVTVRKLKNQSSGLDLCIPTVKEIPGILLDTVEYHVLVVSNLQFFKLPQHKETDVVQFVIAKHFEDFENLRKGLAMQYPGTVLPVLSSSLLPSFLESNTSERTLELENFLKFIAITPKFAVSHVTLEFLGVNPLTAGKYNVSPKINNDPEKGSSKESQTSPSSRFQLFEKDTDEPSDLFGPETAIEDVADEELFSSKHLPSIKPDSGKLFEGQFTDLDTFEGTVDMKMLGFRDRDAVEKPYQIDEDISQLLKFDDEITQLKKLEETVKAQHKTKPGVQLMMHMQKENESLVKDPVVLPSISVKPSLPPKPRNVKQLEHSQKSSLSNLATSALPHDGGNLTVSPKDKTKDDENAWALKLGVDDSLNYIKENPVEDEAEPELF